MARLFNPSRPAQLRPVLIRNKIMPRRRRRNAAIGLLLLTAAIGILALQFPCLPLIHGSTAEEVDRIAAWLDIGPGSRVADFGAGDGAFAIELAHRVGPRGQVYATEVDGDLLAEIRQAAREAGLAHVTVIEGDASDTNLPETCCDAIFSRFVYHHLTDAAAINADLFRALRPGGRLLVIDFEPGSLLDWLGEPETADRHGGHGTPKTTVLKEVTAAGFRVVRGPEPWRGKTYAVLFTRP